MSMRHVVWVLDHLTIKDAKAFRVLISLAEWANKITNEVPAYPIDELITRANMSRSAIYRTFTVLEGMGLIRRRPQTGEQGVKLPPVITLLIDGKRNPKNSHRNPTGGTRAKSQKRGGEIPKKGGRNPSTVGLQESSAIPRVTKTHQESKNLDSELPLFAGGDPPQPPSAKATAEFIEETFKRFYAAYPRKTAPDRARKAWAAAIKKADPSVIIVAAAAYAKTRIGEDPKFTPLPATWLNDGRWKDQPPEPPPLPMTGRAVGII
jgi:hypothetical protein